MWITEIGSKGADGSFEEFRSAITSNEPEIRPLGDPTVFSTAFDVSWNSPSQGPITFGWDAPLTVNGTEQPIADYPRIESPWARVPFDSTNYVIKGGKHTLRLDVSAPSRESDADA